MQNLLKDLETVLEQDSRFMADGRILKNIVVEAAHKMDAGLVKLLLGNEPIRKHFFLDVDGTLVFDKVKFQDFVSNKQFLPDSYTAFKNKIGLFDRNSKALAENKDVVLAWAYKDCVLEGGMTKEEASRDEFFYNTTLAPDEITRLFDPKVLTKFEYWDQDAVKADKPKPVKDIGQSENLLIKGNNLLALHSLKKRYAGKVKLIYIDPPFNTENDSFRYNDSFNHSTWLTFMKNRLEAAEQLLKSDGVICVHIDDNESAYLKVLMDEVFGSENYINTISIRDSHPSGLKLSSKDKTIIKTKSHLIVYAKQRPIKINPQYMSRDDWDTHFNSFVEIDDPALPKFTLAKYIKDNEIVEEDFSLDAAALKNKKFREFAFKNRHKIFQSTKEIPADAKKKSLENKDCVIEYASGEDGREFALNGRRLSPLSKSIWDVGFDGYSYEDFGKLACDFWDDIDFNNTQNEGGIGLPNGKKPERLLARVLSMFSQKGDVVLDFFAGSGTTPAVSHKMGRKWLAIEQMDYIKELPEARLKNVVSGEQSGISKNLDWNGGGSFVYCEIAKWNETFIEKIHGAKATKDLLKIYDGMKEEAFFRYDVDLLGYESKEFEELGFEDQQKALISCLEMNHLYVAYSEIEDKTYAVSEDDKKLNRQFYGDSGKE